MKNAPHEMIGHTEEPIVPEQHHLKDLSEGELFDCIMQAGVEWTDEQRAKVTAAYELGRTLHQNDTHRGHPYVYHLLRNAARIIKYFHITDPDVIAAALLHDSVEDHPLEIVQREEVGVSEAELQEEAFGRLEPAFGSRTVEIVRGMTNPPVPEGIELTYDEKLQRYLDHIEECVEDVGVWLNKLSDWCDNGIGIVHSDFETGSSRRQHFRTKYGAVLPILEARFARPDIQAMLDPVAKANIARMFALARERLLVTIPRQRLGEAALKNTKD